MDLLQHLVDVDGIGLLPLSLLLFLVSLGDSLLGLARLFGSFSRGFGWHVYRVVYRVILTELAETSLIYIEMCCPTAVPHTTLQLRAHTALGEQDSI